LSATFAVLFLLLSCSNNYCGESTAHQLHKKPIRTSSNKAKVNKIISWASNTSEQITSKR
jgi:hypothetical protein